MTIDFDYVNICASQEVEIVGKIEFKVSANPNPKLKPEDDLNLKSLIDDFKDKNKHLWILDIDYWGDGDDSSYYFYADVYFKELPWWEKSKYNPIITIDKIKYKRFYDWDKCNMGKGERLIRLSDKKTFYHDYDTNTITPW